MDADPDGRMICELSNWTGKAYRIPRGKIKDCADREELKSTAIYLLFGRIIAWNLALKYTTVNYRVYKKSLGNYWRKKCH